MMTAEVVARAISLNPKKRWVRYIHEGGGRKNAALWALENGDHTFALVFKHSVGGSWFSFPVFGRKEFYCDRRLNRLKKTVEENYRA